MKTIIILVAMLLCTAAHAYSECGLEPLTPLTQIGCSRMQWVCSCDRFTMECHWELLCIKENGYL